MGLQRNPFTRRIINEGQCSATATALDSACKPRGYACNDSSLRSACASSNLGLTSNSIELAAGYLAKNPFLDVPQNSLIVDGLRKVGWSQVAVVHYGSRCVSPATAPHTLLKATPSMSAITAVKHELRAIANHIPTKPTLHRVSAVKIRHYTTRWLPDTDSLTGRDFQYSVPNAKYPPPNGPWTCIGHNLPSSYQDITVNARSSMTTQDWSYPQGFPPLHVAPSSVHILYTGITNNSIMHHSHTADVTPSNSSHRH